MDGEGETEKGKRLTRDTASTVVTVVTLDIKSNKLHIDSDVERRRTTWVGKH